MKKLFNQIQIIPGRLAKISHRQDLLTKAGLSVLSQNNYIVLKTKAGNVTLRAIKIITRPSGRKHRHLARYLVAVALDTKLVYEIFLEVVQGVLGVLFAVGQWVQKKHLNRLSHSLGIHQTLAIVGGIQ